MKRTIFIFSICFCLSNFLFSQICPDCDDLPEKTLYPRFWEDPDGVIYTAETLDHADKIGTWTFYEDRGNNDIKVLFTRQINCLQNLDGRMRGKTKIKDKVLIYPNPTYNTLNIEHPFVNCNIAIYDVKGVLIRSFKGISKKHIKVDMMNYASGTYFIQLQTETEIVNKLFLVH